MKALRPASTMLVVVALLLASGCKSFGGSDLPGNTAAGPELEKETLATLMAMDQAVDKNCKERKIVDRKVLTAGEQGAVEDWYLDRCGALVRYRITFRLDARGGTLIGWTPGEVVGAVQ
jgi:hypothetical protein